MMFTKEFFRKKLLLLLLFVPIIVLIFLTLIIKKVVYLSSDPLKDCRDITPNSGQDQSKPTTIFIQDLAHRIPFVQKGGDINDISCLNKTAVFGVVKVRSEEELKDALLFASENELKVSISAVKHSMGGQAFYKNAVILDMTDFKQMSVDTSQNILTVQSGATWIDVQNFLDPKGLAVKAMQSSDIFSVGGSISVNAHGMDHNVGSIESTIKSLRVMLSDGSIQTISRTENPELYKLVVGGYGLFGVIIDAQIDVASNEVYERERKVINYKDFPKLFDRIGASKDKYGLMYAHLSSGPANFFNEAIVYSYKKTDNFQGEIPSLQERSNIKLKRFFLNLGKTNFIGRQIKWWAEKYLQPRFESCLVSRNNAMGESEACFVSRNQEMHENAKFLRNNLKNDTDILQEYFIPRDKFIEFVDGAREILQRNNALVLNAGIRVVNKEDIALNYAPQDSFAMVLYLNQKISDEDNLKMEKLTKELIDLTLTLGGRPYLPYQLHFSDEQLKKAYPEIGEFFASKKTYDPDLIFMNNLYAKYAK